MASTHALNLDQLDPELRAIFQKAPKLEHVVKRSVWTNFSQPGDEPFPSDLAFLDLINAIFEVRDAFTSLEDLIKSVHGQLVPKRDEQIPKEAPALLHALEEALAYGRNLVKRRIEAHATARAAGKSSLEPRLVRLARRLDLSDKELYAMGYIAISYGEQLSFDLGRGYSFSTMCRVCNMTITEGLRFISPARQHVKDGIFSPDEDDPVGYSCKIPYTTCLVLTGGELSETDMLKIDKTLLHEIVMEEDDGSEKFSLRRSYASVRNKDAAPGSDDENKDGDEWTNLASDETEDKKDDDTNIYDFLREEVLAESEQRKGSTEETESDSTTLGPYTSNTSYLSDHIDWLGTRIRVRNITREREGDLDKDPKKDLQLRELAAKERMFKAKCDKRLALTVEAGGWMPRLERLAARLQLDTFEKNVLLTLTGNTVSSNVVPDCTTYSSYRSISPFTVRDLLNVFCDGFEEEIQCRKYFYKSAKLIKEGIIRMSDSFTSELMSNNVEIDRRMLDFIVGLDTEFSELVEGSHLYTPVVDLSHVILPDDQKQLIIRTVANFDNFAKSRKRLGFDQVMSYGAGILLLFFGKSGTGKTMMANAVAKMLGKRILLINYPSLGYSVSDEVIRFIFREAKLNDAVLFFDECEAIFQSRDSFSGGVNLLLTEIERHNGLIIMATNRAYDLDEAMHRRITLAIEFKNPDPFLRAAIWKAHIPSTVSLGPEVDFEELAVKYELTGGLIKNAILYALSEAVNRDAEKPVIEHKDLRQGALHQLRGHLSMVDFDRRVVPTRALDEIIVDPKIYKQLQHIIQMEKARQVLYSEWGFSDKMINDQGTTCLFHGPPGTGKTVAAEALGFETGRPLKVINCAELVSKYVGQTGKNIETMFKEAKAMDAILVFDDAEALFGKRTEQSNSTDRYANMDTGLLLYHMERFPGICVVTTNLINNIDDAFFRRFRFVIEFALPPASLRETLWRVHLPSKAPLAKDVDFRSLAERFAFTGGVIKNCCFKAASAVALRVDPTKRIISMADLVEAATDMESTTSGGSAPLQMFN